MIGSRFGCDGRFTGRGAGLLLGALCLLIARTASRRLKTAWRITRVKLHDYVRLFRTPSYVLKHACHGGDDLRHRRSAFWSRRTSINTGDNPFWVASNLIFGAIHRRGRAARHAGRRHPGRPVAAKIPERLFSGLRVRILIGSVRRGVLYVPFPVAWVCILWPFSFCFSTPARPTPRLANVAPPSCGQRPSHQSFHHSPHAGDAISRRSLARSRTATR